MKYYSGRPFIPFGLSCAALSINSIQVDLGGQATIYHANFNPESAVGILYQHIYPMVSFGSSF